jgi:signal transduction histidine kinase
MNDLPDLQEEMRLADLYSFGILDSEQEEDFSQLVELAANITNCQMAAISFIDKDRQWFKAVKNIGLKETRREDAFCHYTIQKDEVMLVADASQDPRFRNNPYVTGDPHINFYAGAPIGTSSGQKVGTVCVFDSGSNRQLSRFQLDALQTIANQVSRLMELRRKNKSLISYTNKLIEAEKALHRLSIKEEEQEKSFIANQLHENFAQTLAATKLYIEFAQTEKDLSESFLSKSKENIEHIINHIRLLCNYIKPIDQFQANAQLLIRELVEQWAANHRVDVDFTMDLNEQLPAASGLAIYRLLQTVLPLTRTYRIQQLRLFIQQDLEIEISLQYRPQTNNVVDPAKLLLLKKSISMAQADGGQLLVSRTLEGRHHILIRLPLITCPA